MSAPSSPADRFRGENPLADGRLWVLMRLNRWVLSAIILGGVFVALLVGATLGPDRFRMLVANHNVVWWIFAAFLGAIITGVTLVVTLNQLVLSQELGSAGDQRERMQGVMEFRHEVEDSIDVDVSPSDPAAFMQQLLNYAQTQAEQLPNVVAVSRNEELTTQVDEYAATLVENAVSVDRILEDAQFGTFTLLWALFQFNYSSKIFRAREIKTQHASALSDDAEDVFDNLIDVLKLFGTGREHFKTLYFQWELINLSRALSYISIPALVLVGIALMNLGPNAVPGTMFGVDNLVLLTSAVYTVGLAPFVVFLVYMLRIATIAKHTLSIGPFVLSQTEHDQS